MWVLMDALCRYSFKCGDGSDLATAWLFGIFFDPSAFLALAYRSVDFPLFDIPSHRHDNSRIEIRTRDCSSLDNRRLRHSRNLNCSGRITSLVTWKGGSKHGGKDGAPSYHHKAIEDRENAKATKHAIAKNEY